MSKHVKCHLYVRDSNNYYQTATRHDSSATYEHFIFDLKPCFINEHPA